jgi:hypothetical protein
MLPMPQLRSFAAALVGLLAGTGVGTAQQDVQRMEDLERNVANLTEKNVALEKSLAESNRAEKEASGQLAKVRERLEALGKNLLDGGNDRLVQAASDIQVLRERQSSLEGTAMRLAATVTDYMRQAVTSDPDARLRVETSVRELDAVLGLRQKPRPDVRTGSLQQARIVSIDSESGLLVLNAGESGGVRTGMTFRLLRGDQPYGKAIVADVRKDVSGALVENLDSNTERVRLGDTASLATE